tara:strand:+ start:2145 stop:2888 length:744 start_codon:yes stop_codon:yes gene_type:complete
MNFLEINGGRWFLLHLASFTSATILSLFLFLIRSFDKASGITLSSMNSELPSIDVLISDAIASGYTVLAVIVDHENNGRLWCANTGKYESSGIEILDIEDKNWISAMEKLHGGPISNIETIILEEQRHRLRGSYSEMLDHEIEEWIQHYTQEIADITPEDEQYLPAYEDEIKKAQAVLDERVHQTWYDPSKPEAIADSPCYCGWLGLDQPPIEFAPPGCNCISRVDPNHGHDVGWINFESKKQEDEV